MLTLDGLIGLVDHYDLRIKTESNVDSTDAIHSSQHGRLWKTVSAIDFDRTGQCLFSAGYDSKLRAYNISLDDEYPKHIVADLGANIDLLAVNKNAHHELLATGSSRVSNSIAIWNSNLKNDTGKR